MEIQPNSPEPYLTRRVVVMEDPGVFEQVRRQAADRGTTPTAYIREGGSRAIEC